MFSSWFVSVLFVLIAVTVTFSVCPSGVVVVTVMFCVVGTGLFCASGMPLCIVWFALFVCSVKTSCTVIVLVFVLVIVCVRVWFCIVQVTVWFPTGCVVLVWKEAVAVPVLFVVVVVVWNVVFVLLCVIVTGYDCCGWFVVVSITRHVVSMLFPLVTVCGVWIVCMSAVSFMVMFVVSVAS